MDPTGTPENPAGGPDTSTRIVQIVLILIGLGLLAFLLVAIIP